MKVRSSLVAVALSLSVGVENSQKLYEVQRTKSSRQKSSQQLERIQKKLADVRVKYQLMPVGSGVCFLTLVFNSCRKSEQRSRA